MVWWLLVCYKLLQVGGSCFVRYLEYLLKITETLKRKSIKETHLSNRNLRFYVGIVVKITETHLNNRSVTQ